MGRYTPEDTTFVERKRQEQWQGFLRVAAGLDPSSLYLETHLRDVFVEGRPFFSFAQFDLRCFSLSSYY